MDKFNGFLDQLKQWAKMTWSGLSEFVLLVGPILYYYVEAFVGLFMPTPKKDVTDKLVLITGAGQGLGRELAIRFANLKTQLALLDINKENLIKTKELIEEKFDVVVRIYMCNVSVEEEVAATLDEVRKDFKRSVDILVNNAGVVNCLPFEELEPKLIKRTFEVNVFAHFWMIKNVLPFMKSKNSGHIVSIASIAGHMGNANLTDYCSSKFASVGLMEALREELRQENYDGIALTTINPVAMNTNMFKHPTTRFSFVLPVIGVETVADRTIDAVLKEKNSISVPSIAMMIHRLSYFMPQKVVSIGLDLLDYNVKPHK